MKSAAGGITIRASWSELIPSRRVAELVSDFKVALTSEEDFRNCMVPNINLGAKPLTRPESLAETERETATGPSSLTRRARTGANVVEQFRGTLQRSLALRRERTP